MEMSCSKRCHNLPPTATLLPVFQAISLERLIFRSDILKQNTNHYLFLKCKGWTNLISDLGHVGDYWGAFIDPRFMCP